MHHWTETPIHFVDFEGNRTSGILEYGIATVLGGSVVATATRLCAPLGWIRAGDTSVHGITEQDANNHAAFDTEWETFASMRERGPLAAHFAATENSLLRATWPYSRMSPDFTGRGAESAEWGPWIDTGILVPGCLTGIASRRLEDLVTDCGVESELLALADAHCPPARRRYHAALFDALASALLLISLGRREEFESMTIPWLLAQSRSNPDDRDEIQQGCLF